MRPLILDVAAQERLRAVREHAEAHPIPIATMLRMAQGKVPPVGVDRRHRAAFAVGWLAVYSVEEHHDGWYRHLSVSVRAPVLGAEPTTCPNPKAVALLAQRFGFTIGEDLDLAAPVETGKLLLMPSTEAGWLVPNLLERFKGVPT